MRVTLLREALVYFFLQKSVPIQPKTSNSLPKFCQPTLRLEPSDVVEAEHGIVLQSSGLRESAGLPLHAEAVADHEVVLEMGDMSLARARVVLGVGGALELVSSLHVKYEASQSSFFE